MTRPDARGGSRRAGASRSRATDTAALGTDEPEDAVADDAADAAEAEERADAPAPRAGRRSGGGRLDWLYEGNGGIDIIGRKKTWYGLFAAVVVVCLLSIAIRGFNFGIDFEGGSTVQFPASTASGPVSTEQVQQVFADATGRPAESVQTAGTGPSATVLVRSERLDPGQVVAVREALFQRFQPLGTNNAPDPNSITDSAVSASWGGEITRQALIALAVFLVLVALYLTFYFERRMALAALVTLANDILITAGVYSLVGFEVSPATVIGLLTILGFSLYDTVVVFDKVRENTRGLLGLTRRTYAEAANLAVNQTLMRSLNTSLIAALPLIGLFVVGVVLLGVGVLGDLALVQLVGTIIGAASSVLLATPIVVDLAMRHPDWARQAKKVEARRAKTRGRGAAPSEGDGTPDAVGPVDAAGEPTDAIDTRAVTAGAGGTRPSSRPSTAAQRRSPAAGGRNDASSAPRPGARPAGKSSRGSGGGSGGGRRRK